MTGVVRFIVASLLSLGGFLVVATQGIASWQLWLGMRVAMACHKLKTRCLQFPGPVLQ